MSKFWGKKAERLLSPDSKLMDPLTWNAEAARQRIRRRVFCMDSGDLFEDRRDLDAPRDRVLELIGATPWLDWWIFTRRPGLIRQLAPAERRATWGENVFLGISIEDQVHADKLIPELFETPATGYHVSCCPLLGPIDLRPYLHKLCWVKVTPESAMNRLEVDGWYGPGGRRTLFAWMDDIRRQCAEAGVWLQPHQQRPSRKDLPPGMTTFFIA